MNAGEYRWRWQWFQCVRTADGTTGDKPKTYTSNGYLWGTAELTSANEQNEYGAPRYIVTGQVRFRQFLALSPLDRLVLLRDNQTFIIDGVRKDFDNNQTIADIHSLSIS